ncbi:hypothetical protein FHG87_008387 [Trinorchestia longiramus]|nr:hypothetical protein FHG87_008387 [Trinorchestia longiramus]
MDMEVSSSDACDAGRLTRVNTRSNSTQRSQPTISSHLSNGMAVEMQGNNDSNDGSSSDAGLPSSTEKNALTDGEDEGGGGKLKRSCSAPMINQLLPGAKISAPLCAAAAVTRPESSSESSTSAQSRARRFSASFGPVSPLSPLGGGNSSSGGGGAPSSNSGRSCSRMRVCQLREEEGMDIVNREVAHEREVQSSLQMARTLSQSCEDLVIDLVIVNDVFFCEDLVIVNDVFFCEDLVIDDDPRKKDARSVRAPDYSDPLHLNIGFAAATLSSATSPCPGGSASPTRPGRQCFSPSLQQCVRNSPFTPSPSKRPPAFMARRSLSPITPRSSPLRTVKRKCESSVEEFATPSKRLSVGGVGEAGGGLLIAQPHRTESSSSCLRAGSAFGSSVPGTSPSFCSSFSSFKQFQPSTSSAPSPMNVFSPQHPVNADSPNLETSSSPFSSQFSNTSGDINANKNSSDSSLPFSPFRTNVSEPQQLYPNFGSASKSVTHVGNVFSVGRSSPKNPFSVRSSNSPNNPFLGSRSDGDRTAANPFLQTSGSSARRNGGFQVVGSVETNRSDGGNPFLRANCDSSPTPGLPSLSGSGSAPASAGSSPRSASQHPHLFRPVSPAAVNAAAVATVTDAPVAATPIRPISVDEMMAEDHPSAGSIQQPQQMAMDHQAQSSEHGQPTQQEQHMRLLRADACPRTSDVNPVGTSESDRRNRVSLDSNKSFQEMDLSEDVGQASLGMLH